jgi:hypothetical protein
MYLNRIRPPKPKFVAEVTKAEFVPDEPVIKTPEVKTAADVASAFGIPPDVLDQVDPMGEQLAAAKENMKGSHYALLPYAELKKLVAERGIKTTRNPKKDELVELLGGSECTQKD